ncbi:YkgJ family cysteine cluster protein [Candidatus Woesearchaeota archaeon]|nr:YkgJ family cysteine cluster protein [Candidatus Woesearchaeota archaeon]
MKLAHPCKCDACTVGCLHGSGVFAPGEIEKLAEFMNVDAEVLKKEFLEEIEKFNTKKFRPRIKRKNHPYGKCIFFDEKLGCKIHEAKPLECKIAMGCKPYGEQLALWFMLNHFVNKDDAESVRQYASYLKTGGKTLDGGKLEELVPDKEKLRKILSFEILK